MRCPNCNAEIDDDAVFCTYCGAKIDATEKAVIEPIVEETTTETEEELPTGKATFKEGIVALFTKIFQFKGKTRRSEFNFGLLFLILIGIVIGAVCSGQYTADVTALINQFAAETITFEEFEAAVNALDPTNYPLYMVGTIVSSVGGLVLLCAPLFRRINSALDSTTAAWVFTGLYIASEVVSVVSALVIIPSSIATVTDLVSFAGFIGLCIAVFKKDKRTN